MQQNGFDCGVFLSKFADYLTADRKLTFSQSNMSYFRQKMIIDMLNEKVEKKKKLFFFENKIEK